MFQMYLKVRAGSHHCQDLAKCKLLYDSFDMMLSTKQDAFVFCLSFQHYRSLFIRSMTLDRRSPHTHHMLRKTTVKVSWLHNRFDTHRQYSTHIPAKCTMNTSFLLTRAKCYNYSSVFGNGSLYSKLNQNYNFIVLTLDKTDQVSWIQASNLCRNVLGYLPILRKREELNHLIALIKLSPLQPFVKELFLGTDQEVRGISGFLRLSCDFVSRSTGPNIVQRIKNWHSFHQGQTGVSAGAIN